MFSFFVALQLAAMLRTFVAQPFDIPSESNVPNLMPGDYFLASKLAYHYGGHPHRGDVVVFKYPKDMSISYAKRVIGLPGDRVQLKRGHLYINEVEMQRDEVAKIQWSKGLLVPIQHFYRETLSGGRSYVIGVNDDAGLEENTPEYIVPLDRYFVLGDNRSNSSDSRYLNGVGYVPEENFIGPLLWRYWNSKGYSLEDLSLIHIS